MNNQLKLIIFIVIIGVLFLVQGDYLRSPSLKNFHQSSVFSDVERAIDRYLTDGEMTVKTAFKIGDINDLVNEGYLSYENAQTIYRQTGCKHLKGIKFKKTNEELALSISKDVCEGAADPLDDGPKKTYEYSNDDSVLKVSTSR